MNNQILAIIFLALGAIGAVVEFWGIYKGKDAQATGGALFAIVFLGLAFLFYNL